jgi:hypothetical protein
MLTPAQRSMRYAENQYAHYGLNRFKNAELPDGILLPMLDAPISHANDSFHVSMHTANPNSEMRDLFSQMDSNNENIRSGDWWTKSDEHFTITPSDLAKAGSTREVPLNRKDHMHLAIETKERISRNSDQRKETAAITTKETLYPKYKETLIVDGTQNRLALFRQPKPAQNAREYPEHKTVFKTDLSMPIITDSRKIDDKFLQARKQLSMMQNSLESAKTNKDERKIKIFKPAISKLEESIGNGARKWYSAKTQKLAEETQKHTKRRKLFKRAISILNDKKSVQDSIFNYRTDELSNWVSNLRIKPLQKK